jgi:hypothetical protein
MAKQARKFGVELEIVGGAYMAASRLASKLNAAGVATTVPGYTHETMDSWKIVPDGSLAGHNAYELVSPPMPFTAASVETLRLVCAVLNANGVTVNSSCGFHVHVDANDLSADAMKKLLATVVRFEGAINSLVPASRRRTDWAKSVARTLGGVEQALKTVKAAETVADLRSALNCDRYHNLNLEATRRHGTVEFRQAAGTTDADKVVGWVAMCVGLVNRAGRLRDVESKTQFTFSRLLSRVEAPYRHLLVARRAQLAEREAATR